MKQMQSGIFISVSTNFVLNKLCIKAFNLMYFHIFKKQVGHSFKENPISSYTFNLLLTLRKERKMNFPRYQINVAPVKVSFPNAQPHLPQIPNYSIPICQISTQQRVSKLVLMEKIISL
jgi:hypothetical protein